MSETIEKILGYKTTLEKLKTFLSPSIFESLNKEELKKMDEDLTSLNQEIKDSDIPNYFKENLLTEGKNYSRLVNVSQNSKDSNRTDNTAKVLLTSLLGVAIGFFGMMGYDALSTDLIKKVQNYVKEAS